MLGGAASEGAPNSGLLHIMRTSPSPQPPSGSAPSNVGTGDAARTRGIGLPRGQETPPHSEHGAGADALRGAKGAGSPPRESPREVLAGPRGRRCLWSMLGGVASEGAPNSGLLHIIVPPGGTGEPRFVMHFVRRRNMFRRMTNRFGVVLHTESVRWAAAEGVSEDVIAAVLLLHEHSVDEIAPKLSAIELEQVIKLVGRSPRLYPPGILDALNQRRTSPSPQPRSGSAPISGAPARVLSCARLTTITVI